MADLYSTQVLGRIIRGLMQPNNFLLSTFFPQIQTFKTEKVVFDFEASDRMALPYVSPLKEGQVFRNLGFQAKEFAPAYLKPKTTIEPLKSLKRRMGEKIGGDDMSPQERTEAALTATIERHIKGVYYRLEQMAGEVLSTGKLVITGKDYPLAEVDYGRTAGFTETLTTSARWGESGVSAYDGVINRSLEFLLTTGTSVTDIVFTTDSWALFIADQKAKDSISTEFMGNTARIDLGTSVAAGGQLQGKLGAGGPNLWVYSNWYTDPEDGVTKPVLPTFSVAFGSSAEPAQGSQLFGAIIDDDIADGEPTEGMFISKSWTEKDPGRRLVMTQSAPLIAPGNPNCMRFLKVR